MIAGRKLLVLLVTVIFVGSVQANPAGGVVSAGDVQITQSSTQTHIQQNSQKAIINWNSFNIGAGEKTHFQQPQGGIALNRINATQGASQIYGQLTATGKIILVNQAGIFFGPGSYVNVGSIIASTSNISDSNFLAGKLIFDQPSPFNASVVNKGTIIAAQNGLVAMLGNNVTNEGLIQAQGGNVVLASGKKFTVDLYGDQLINFAVDEGITETGKDEHGNPIKDAVKNSGTIVADGGKILMTAKSASGVVDNVINMKGVAQARTVYQKNGEIILAGGNEGIVKVSGKMHATGKSRGDKGGKVHVTGKKVLVENAEIDVSGDTGAGEILLGGDYQGKGSLPNAAVTVVSPDVSLLANAGTLGNGGKVIVWGDEATFFHGSISATGGAQGGDGGLVETSGHYLDVEGARVDTRAPIGTTGTWLLDPTDLTISSGSTSNVTTSGTTYTGNADQTSSVLNVSTLTTALASANVYVLTTSGGSGSGSGDITVASAISWSSAFNLTLSAYRHIVLNANVTNTTSSTAILNLQADNSGTGTGTISGSAFAQMAGGTTKINAYYNPTTFGTQDTLYTGGTTPTKFMLINSLGTSSDSATTRSLGAVSNNTSLWSQNFALGKDIDASGTTTWNSGAGFSPIGNASTSYTGKFDGQGHVIDGLYINRSTNDRVAFFGQTSGATITRLGLTNINYTGRAVVGGLIGYAIGSSSINQSYTSGSITGTKLTGQNAVGGVIGESASGTTLSNSYSLTNVTSNNDQTIGGLIGWNDGTITNSYSTGLVTANGIVSSPVSGLANGGGSASNSYWDTETSGKSTSTQGTGKTTSQLLTSSTYTSWSLATSGSTTATPVSQTWFMPATSDSTRPMLMSEWQTSITNAHQIQLVTSTQGASYKMLNDVSFSTGLGNIGEVWGTNRVSGSTGSGFYPLTLGSAGIFNGQNYAISNLIIQRSSSSDSIGLFRLVDGSGTTVKNVGLLNASITGGTGATGGIAGIIQNNAVLDTVYNKNGTVSSSTAVGGLAGSAFASAVIQNSYNTSAITGSTSQVGGILGTSSFSNVTNSYNIGNISGTSVIGGVIGAGSGTITLSGVFNTGTIQASTGTAGGLIADFNGTGLTLTNSYNIGTVSATTTGGGLIGVQSGPLSAAQTFSAASVSGTTKGALAGSLGASASGSFSNTYWDSGISGAPASAVGSNSSSVTGIPSGSTTNNMKTQSTFSGFSFPGTWKMILGDSYTYPTLAYENAFGIDFIPTASSTTSSIVLAANGQLMSSIIKPQAVSTTAHPNDYVYVLRQNDLLGSGLLIYSTGTNKGNLVLNTDYTNVSGVTMATNGVIAAGTTSNANLGTAKGSLSTSDILYSVSSSALTLNSNINFSTISGSTYSPNTSVTTSGTGTQTYSGSISLGANASLISGSGAISAESVVGNGFSLTINSTGTSAINSVISGTSTVLNKQGSGTLTLSGTNTYTGGTSVTAGTVQIGNASGLGTGTLTLNGGTFQTTGSLAIANAMTIGSSGGTISNSSTGFTLNGNITLNGALTFASPNDTTFAGNISGTGSINKNSSSTGGRLFLSGNNTYSGSTTASAGFLVLNSNTALGTGTLILNGSELRTAVSGTTLANTWQVDAPTSITTFQDLTLTGPGTLNAALTNNSTVATTTLSGNIGGTGSITQTGSGVLALSGTNTYSGGTTISASTLRIENNSALGSPSGSTFASITSGAVLNLNGFTLTIPTAKTLTVNGTGSSNGAITNGSGTGTIAASGTGSINLATDSSFGGTGTWTISAPISGAALTKVSSGTLTLSGANTYTGGTTIKAGTLTGSSAAANAFGTNTITIGDSAGGSTNATLLIGTTGLSYSNALALASNTSGTLTIGNTGTAISTTFTGGVTGTNNLTINSNATTGTLTFATGQLNNIGTITNIGAGTGATTISAVIGSNVTGVIQNSSTANLILSGANTYTGNTTITLGTLKQGAANVIPNGAGKGDLSVTGTFDLNGFNSTINGLSGAGTINNSTGSSTYTLSVGNNNNTSTFNGIIQNTSGTVALTKAGSGTFTFTGANTYSGLTTLSAGTFALSGSGTMANSSVANSATFDISAITPSSASIVSLSGAGGVTLGAKTLSLSNASGTYSGVMSGTGGFTLAGGSETFSNSNTYTGTTTINAGTLTYGASNVLASGALTINGATAVLALGSNQSDTVGTITVSGGGSITGSGTSSLSTTGTFEMQSGSVGAILAGTSALNKTTSGTITLTGANTYSGLTTLSAGTLALSGSGAIANSSVSNSATFDISAVTSSASIVSLAGNGGVSLGAKTLSLSNASGTYSGAMSGSGGNFTLAGGSETLSGANTFTGTTTINAGTLTYGASNVLASAITVDGATAVLALGSNQSDTVGTITVANGGSITGSGTSSLSTTGTFEMQSGSVSAILAGTGALNKTTSGTITLTGANSYSGATLVSAGTLRAGVADTLSQNSATTISGGAVLDLNNTTTQSVGSLAGAGNVTLGSGSGTTFFAGVDNSSTSFSGVISGIGPFYKNGTGTLTLTGTNTYSGITYVNVGKISLSGSGTLGSTAAGTQTSTGATLELNGVNTGAETILINGTGVGGAGALVTLGATSNTVGGAVTVGSNATIAVDDAGASLSLAAISGSAAELTINNTGTVTQTGALNGSALSLTKNGTGTLTLAQNNSYNGATTVNAGTLQLSHAGALGSTSSTTIASGAFLTVNNVSLTNTNSISLTGTLTGIGTANLSNAITLNAGHAVSTTDTLTLAGQLTGSNGFTKNSTGTVILSNSANNYTGTTSVNAGTLELDHAAALGSTSSITVAANATLNLNNITLSNTNAISLSGALTGSGTSSMSNVITLNSGHTLGGTGTLTLAGQLTGSSGLTKGDDPGTIILSSASNNYTGSTSVQGGVLQLNNAAALGSTSSISVLSGGTLNLNNIALGNTSAVSLTGQLTGTGTASMSNVITLNSGNSLGGTGTLTLSAQLTGSGGLNKNDSGTVILSSSANNYTGTTSINAGTLQSGASNVIPNASAMTLANTSGAIFNLAGFGDAIGTLSGGGTNGGNIMLGVGGGTLGVTQNSTQTYAGVISGSGILTKLGTSTLILSGSNTYTGTTNINAGTLQLGASEVIADTNPVVLGTAAGVTFNLAGFNETIGNLSGGSVGGGNITLGSGTLRVNLDSDRTYNGTISGTGGGFIKAGTNTLTLSRTNHSYTGPTTILSGTLSVAGIGNGGVASGIGASTNAASNLVLGGGTLRYTGATTSTDRAFTLTNGTTSSIEVTTAGTTLTMSGAAAATTGGLTKIGSGTLTLSGANAYTGATTINAGTLQLGASNVIADSSAVTLADVSGVIFDLNNFNDTIGTLSGAGSNGGNISLGSGTLTVTQSSDQTYAGVISGSGALTKTGANTLTLSGANSYTGNTTINAGTLQLGASNVIADASALTLADVSGVSFNLNNFSDTIGTLSGAGSNGGNISLGSGTLTVTQGSDQTYGGIISGSGGFTKAGANILTLSGANTYTGTTTINAGTVALSNSGAIASSSVANSATFDISAVIPSSASIVSLAGSGGVTLGAKTLSLSNASGTYSGVMNGTGGFTLAGGSEILSGANTYSGVTTVSAGTLELDHAAALGSSSSTTVATAATLNVNNITLTNSNALSLSGTLTGSGTSSMSNVITLNSGHALGGTGTLTLSGQLTGSNGLTKNDSGTVIVSSTSNNYTGTTSINSGTLQLGAADVIPNASAVTLANTSGAAFNLAGFTETVGTLSGAGSNGGNISLGSGTLTVTQGSDQTYAGVISGSGGFTKAGGNTLTLSGANSYTGTTNINAGILKLGASNVIADASTVTLADVSGVAFNLNNFSDTIGTLSGAGSNGGNISLGSGTLTVTQGSDQTYAGIISGSGGFTKAGGNTLTLSGANSYTGTTNINAGILKLGASDVIADASTVTLADVSGVSFNLNNFSDTIGTLSGAGSNGGNISLGSGTLTVTQGSDQTYAGIISGSGGFTKAGANTLTLSGANSYTGTTNINAGILKLGASNVIADASAVTLADVSGVSFNLNNFSDTIGTLSGAGSNGGNISLGSGTLTVTQGSDQTYAGIISGSGSLTKAGANTLTLSGANSYTGTTNINAGILKLGASNVIADASAVTLADVSGVSFNLNNFSDTIGTLSGAGSNGGNISLGSGTLTVTQGSDQTYAGIMSGTGAFIKAGANQLNVSGNNTYSGGTTINSGILEVSHNNALGTGTTTISSGAELLLNAVSINNNLNISGTGISNSGAVVTTGAATNTINGNLTLASNTLFTTNASDTLTVGGSVDGGFGLTISGSGNLNLQSSSIGLNTKLSSLTINTTGAVDLHHVATTGGQTYSGSAISAHSTYTADTGDITFNAPLTLNSNTTMTATTGNIYLNSVDGAYTLGLTAGTASHLTATLGGSTALSSLTTNGSALIGGNITTSGAQTYNSPITLTNNATLTMTGSNNLNITSGITGDYNLNVGGGSNNTFTFTGGLDVNNIDVTAGSGSNSLIVNNNQNQTWTITAPDTGSISGLSELAGTFTFANIQHWQSGSGANTLVAANTTNTWTVTGSNAGTVTGISNAFSNFQNLSGGSGTDTFTLNGGTLSGSINGNGGTNSLTGDAVANTWVVTGANSGTVTGVSGGFSNIQNLIGGSSTDSFTLNGGTLSGSISGGSGANSLTAANVANTWNISGSNAGSVTGITGGFTNIQSVTGGSNNDTFTFGASGSLSNVNAGAGGVNLLDYSNYGSAVSFVIGGAATGITTSNSNFTQVTGSTIGEGTLTGANVSNTWNITNDDAGTVTGLSDGFSQFNNLVGGTNNDSFIFTNGKKVTGTINGGAGGVNTLDLSNYTTNVTVTLTGSGVNGFTGTTSASLGSPNPTGGFSNMTSLNASSKISLIVRDVNNVWNITGTNAGTYNDGTSILAFSNLPKLTGGTANDTFIFSDGAGMTGLVAGNTGYNLFDYSVYTTAVTANLATNAQTGTGTAFDVSEVIGGTAHPDLNTILAPNNLNTWTLSNTTANAGTVTSPTRSAFSYSQFGNIVGGSGYDTFVFGTGSSVTGTLNGGGGTTGIDTLNYSAYTTTTNINMVTGVAPAITGGFTFNSFKNFVGGSANNTLTGPNTTNSWVINSNSGGTLNTNHTFSNFRNIVGGSGADTFSFSNSTVNVLSLDGGAGSNSFDYTSYNNTAVNVNLATSTAPGTASFSRINNFIGSNSSSNTITGANTANTWNITGTNTGNINSSVTFSKFGAITGGTGGNTFNIATGGSLSGKINGGGTSSSNTLSYNAYSNPVAINLTLLSATGTGGYTNIGNFIGTSAATNSTLTGRNSSSTWNITSNNTGNIVISGSTFATFSQFGNVIGGTTTDTFVFSNGANITNSIDGGTGTNTLNYAAYTTPVNVSINGLTNISSVTGSSSFASTNTLTGATSGNYVWTLTGANAGSISGSKAFTFSNFGTWAAGSGSTNKLVAQNVANTWNVTGSNAGNLNNAITFSGFSSLQGGSANDTFLFSDGASISGALNGGAGGTNVLNYSAYTNPVTVDLSTGLITNISSILGATGKNNILIGPHATNIWTIDSASSGSIASGGNPAITFSRFGTLTGGIANDTFVFTNNATVSSISAGTGTNTYDYSSSTNTNPITINLGNGSVTGISNFVGPTNISGNNTLIGPNSSNTWTITGNNSGNINGSTTFSNFGNVTGGNVADTYKFNGTSVGVTGTITNGALDYTLYNGTSININLASGSAPGTGGISGITNIIGSNGANTLTAANTVNTWTITGTDTGNINGTTSFSHFKNLIGGTNNDTFVFSDSSSVTGLINGGSGTNTFNYSGYTAPQTINLLTSVVPGVASFSNVSSFIGNSSTAASNTLMGSNSSNTWAITNNNTGTLNSTISFSNFGNLTGGVGSDTFTFSDGKKVTGTINGGSGPNILDFSQYTTALTYTLTGSTVSGYSGTTSGTPNPTNGFTAITQINGGTSTNNLITTNSSPTIITLTGDNSGTIANASVLTFNGVTTLTGGSGNNRLQGTNNATTWNITGANAGNVNGTINFANIANLQGGSANDTFLFSDGASISGALNGGSGGMNSLDYSAYTSPVTVDLSIGVISNISSIIGVEGENNILIGPHATTIWTIDSASSGSIASNGNSAITFTHFGTLTGGLANDTFVFTNNATVSSISAGSGNNTYDYSSSTNTNPITINLGNGSVTGISHFIGATNISGDNTLIGANSNNTWNITGNNSGNINGSITFSQFGNLTGGSASNIYLFKDTSVGVTGTITNGTLDYTFYNGMPVNINFATGSASATGGMSGITNIIGSSGVTTLTAANTVNTWTITGTDTGNINSTISFSHFKNLVGGTNNDTFVFSDSSNITGLINGNGGTNTFNYSGYSAPQTINFANGIASSVANYSNISVFIGNSSTAASNTLIGFNTSNTWSITNNNAGTLNSAISFSNFGSLTGGNGSDTFSFGANGALSGSINGGTGANTINYANYTAPVTVNLTTSTTTGLTGSLSSITNFIANNANAINNTFISANTENNWLISSNNTGSINNIYHFDGFGNLVGGTAVDVFTFLDNISITGTVNGGGGSGENTLDYTNYTTPVNINLTNQTATGTGGYLNIDHFTGDTINITP